MADHPGPSTGGVSFPDVGVQRDVELATDAQHRLDEWLTALCDDGELDGADPSLLPGWTVGHVLAHLRFNAESHTRMFVAAARGDVGEQYPGGAARRDREIDEHADRPAPEQVEAIRAANRELEARWASSRWEGGGARGGGITPLTELPFLRLREVELHRVDLGLGYELADLSPDYVRLELRRLEMLWTARRPMGLTGLPRLALELEPHQRLGWLSGRLDVDGLAPADVF
jgi:maleylpyruvate isomerase